jgi:integrase
VSKDPWKYKYLGYYETQEEGLTTLALYNQNPYDLDEHQITFSEVYKRWSEEHYPKISHANMKVYKASYRICESLYTMRFIDIRLSHLQGLVDHCGKNYPMLQKVKILLTQLFTYAMKHDICLKNYAHYVDIQQYKDRNPDKTARSPFTIEEINDLWSSGTPGAKVTLMLIYTGVRIGELLDLKKENVNLKEQWFDVVASKTAAGIRRVPIADKVLPFFHEFMDRDCPHLLCSPEGLHMSYKTFLVKYWTSADHKPHDTRHTCVSLLVQAGIDEKIIKRIVGHRGDGVTERVYTHFDFQILLDAINTI